MKTERIHCPSGLHVDAHPSAVVYPNGIKCFVCGYFKKGEPDGVILSDRSSPHPHGSVHPDNEPVALSLINTWNAMLFSNERALYYLRERGISDTILRSMLIGYTGFCYAIPVIQDKRVVTVRYRSDDDFVDKKAFWGTRGKNSACLYGTPQGTRVVVVEGEMDVLTVLSHGYTCITTTNGASSLPGMLDLLGNWRGRLILCGDQDSPGKQAQIALATRALLSGKFHISLCRFDEKDITDVYRERGSQGLRDVIDGAIAIRRGSDIDRFFSEHIESKFLANIAV